MSNLTQLEETILELQENYKALNTAFWVSFVFFACGLIITICHIAEINIISFKQHSMKREITQTNASITKTKYRIKDIEAFIGIAEPVLKKC